MNALMVTRTAVCEGVRLGEKLHYMFLTFFVFASLLFPFTQRRCVHSELFLLFNDAQFRESVTKKRKKRRGGAHAQFSYSPSMHWIEHISVALPLLVGCYLYRYHPAFEMAIVFLFNAAACSLSAFMLWLRATHLANTYLQERHQRKEYRLKCALDSVRSPSAPFTVSGGPSVGSTATKETERNTSSCNNACTASEVFQKKTIDDVVKEANGNADDYPRTVARLAPVRPALLAVCFLLLVLGSLVSVGVLTIVELRRPSHPSSRGVEGT